MLTQIYRRNTTIFSYLINGFKLGATRKIYYLLILIMSLIMIEAYVILQYGWNEALGQSPFTVMFLGIAAVQVWEHISELRKNTHRLRH
jgi:hypothetical protein